jgi:TolA-binding protein
VGLGWSERPAEKPASTSRPAAGLAAPTGAQHALRPAAPADLRAPEKPAALPAPSEADEANPGEAPDPGASEADASARSAVRRRATEEVAPADAKSLFKAANDARKAGQSGRALATYRRLQQSFPSSPEARLSFVLSGRLLLSQGQAAQALSQFDRYLGMGSPGGLGEEALWGKAQALSRLGRASEERAVWRTLLDRYPESVYAPAARRRLDR